MKSPNPSPKLKKDVWMKVTNNRWLLDGSTLMDAYSWFYFSIYLSSYLILKNLLNYQQKNEK